MAKPMPTRLQRLLERAPRPIRILVGLVLFLMAIRGAADSGLGIVQWSGALWIFSSSRPVWIAFLLAGLFLLTVDLWAPRLLSRREDRTEGPVIASHIPMMPAFKTKRQFLPANITPEYLTDLFDGRTDLQAKHLVEPYIGKWMRVAGLLGNVGIPDEHSTQVTFEKMGIFDGGGRFETHGHLYMHFKPVWEDRLAVLRPKTSIAVLGRLRKLNWVEVHLEDCELVDGEGAG